MAYSNEVVYGRKLERDILLAKGPQRMAGARVANGLFADEVVDHLASGLEDRAHVAKLSMLLTDASHSQPYSQTSIFDTRGTTAHSPETNQRRPDRPR
jgi:hypothetical protein